MIDKKRLAALIAVVGLMLLCLLSLFFVKPKTSTLSTAPPETPAYASAIFEGTKSQEFYDSTSYANYHAAEYIVGDFLINTEKTGNNNVTKAEITSFSDEFGDNAEYITNFEFKSLDNKKSYKAKIINYMDNSKSSKLIIIDKNYEKTFGKVI